MKIVTNIYDISGLETITAKPKDVDGAGTDITISAGDAFGTDQNGGILHLTAGRGTGAGYNEIDFNIAEPNSGGGPTNLNNTIRIANFGYDGLLIEKDLFFRAGNDRKVQADTQGTNDADGTHLIVAAGDAGTGGVDHAGGTLNLSAGASTGVMQSRIAFLTAIGDVSGNTPNTPVEQGHIWQYSLIMGTSHNYGPASGWSIVSGDQNALSNAEKSITVGQSINNGSAYTAAFGNGTMIGSSSEYSAVFGFSNSIYDSAPSNFLAGEGNEAATSHNAIFGRSHDLNSGTGFGGNILAGDNHTGHSIVDCAVFGSAHDIWGEHVTAIGKGAQGDQFGQFVHAQGNFAGVGDAQSSKYVMRITTTDATPTELSLDGDLSALYLQTKDDRAYFIKLVVIAKSTTAVDASSWLVEFMVVRGTGFASCVIQGSGAGATPFYSTAGMPAITIDYDVDTATDGHIIIKANGDAGTTIRWVASVEVTEVCTA